MGDRTNVGLRIPKALVAKAAEIDEDLAEPQAEFTEADGCVIAEYEFEEINYATLGCEEGLQEAGIPYHKWWGAGDEYSSGDEHFRLLPEGQFKLIETYDNSDWCSMEEVEKLLPTPEALVTYLKERIEARRVPPLDQQQVELSKTWRLEKLLTG